MEETLKDILPEGNVNLVLSEDGSGKGAALVAAVASKHKPDYTQWKLCGHNVNITEKDVDWYQLNYSWWAHCKLYENLTLSLKALVLVLNIAFSYDLEMKTREQNGNNKRTEIERFDWLIERIQTRVAFGWLSKRSGEKTQELSRNQSNFALTSYCKKIGQSNNACSILGFSLAGKRRGHGLTFFVNWLIKKITNTYQNHFSRSYENRSDNLV